MICSRPVSSADEFASALVLVSVGKGKNFGSRQVSSPNGRQAARVTAGK